MYNAANTDLPLLLLPMKYLDEVKNAPKSKLNLQKALDQRAGLDKIGGFLLSDEVVSVVRLAMTRALNRLVPELDEKCIAAYKEFMPVCPDWTEVNTMQMILKVWTRMISHVMAGPELSQSDEWLQEMLLFIPTIIKASFALRTGYHKSMYWIAKYITNDIKEIYRLRSRLGKLLKPYLDDRIAIAAARSKTPNAKGMDLHADAIQWFVDEYKRQGITPSPDQIARDMLMLSLASFLSTAATTLGIIYDLLDQPESFQEIKDEMAHVSKESGGKVTRQSLGQLVVLDSFIKESQRTNPINQISTHRLALQDFTFKDGLHLPAGADIAFSNELISRDPDIWPDRATEFDPHRFLRMRQAGDLARSQVTSVTDDMMPFGNGPHVCPGRFLAVDGMKMMLLNMIYRYEFKYPEGVTSRPENGKGHHTMLPCSTMPLLFKEKKVYSFE
ncbi:hypothetical protein S7711_00275 [Stachybotrys chartarum IBT 7711]|uniref:Uncharacterized protein n=1 Tax=Stachybotrys chartarum (strain CBS 109288 / IBT 7711) TaxID=1280523 RepID=A0A084B3Z8_STACB|nr:hypothetical protein S7711_00275 [Stachybotrys chartarum IBT 7711]KFA54248.1 hypothetical protein S40293_07824 [Stachybotrys chartarum IBT 40293]